MNEKMMKIFGAIIAGFVVFIFILFCISSCSNTKYTFEKLEQKMLKVANAYYEANKDELPANDKDSKTLTLKKMISDGKIDEVVELFDDDTMKCDGNVTVTNNNGYYLYSPYLSCKDKYETKYLADKIIEDSLVESGNGLYEVKDEYIMRGETKNNYLKFNGKNFRIMRINEDGSIRVIQTDAVKQVTWDNRYNPDNNNNSGINEYYYNSLDSRLKETITNYYNDKEAWPETTKSYIQTQDICIGKRSEEDVTKDGSTECSKILEDQVFSAPAVYEYLTISLDANCNSTLEKSCQNYNWLSDTYLTTWTITADAESGIYVYQLYKRVTTNNASGYSDLRVVFNISDKAIYVAGDGSKESPYEFK